MSLNFFWFVEGIEINHRTENSQILIIQLEAVTVKFSKGEAEKQRKEKSYQSIKNKEQEEPWVNLRFNQVCSFILLVIDCFDMSIKYAMLSYNRYIIIWVWWYAYGGFFQFLLYLVLLCQSYDHIGLINRYFLFGFTLSDVVNCKCIFWRFIF